MAGWGRCWAGEIRAGAGHLPACLQLIEAVASDGRVRGHCTVAGKFVDFIAGSAEAWDAVHRARLSQTVKQRWQDPEYRAKISAAAKKRWQDPEYRAKHSRAKKQG